MMLSARVPYSLRLGSRHAVLVEEIRDWRGRLRRQCRVVDLPPGLLRPSPMEPNITDPTELESRLRALIGSDKKQVVPIVLVLPDLCVRATLLEMETLPPRRAERDALIRWRLEQASAFPLAGARVVARLVAPDTVLAVAIRETVLRQYETVCEAVGLCPVVVEAASLCLWTALADRVPGAEPIAWLGLLDGGFTFLLQHAGRPVFLRTKIQSDAGEDGHFQDLSRSLAFSAKTHPASVPRRVMLISEDGWPDLVRRAADELSLEVVRVNAVDLSPAGEAQDAAPMPVETLPAVAGLRRNPLRVNLSGSARPYLGPVRAGLAVLSLLLVGLIGWDLLHVKTIEAQVAEAERALARVLEQDNRLRLQAQTEGVDLSDAAVQRLPAEVAFANHVIAKRIFSWTRLLTDLEEAVPPRVAISAIQLDQKNSMIALGGAAKSLQDLTAFIIRLEEHHAFKDVALAQHRVTENGLVEFGLTVRYNRESKGG